MAGSTIELNRLRAMEPGDIDAVHALSVEVRWPHRPDDWRFVLEIGHGLVATDEGGRVMGSAMWWPFGEDLATIGMVIVSPRLQGRGTGRRLMREIFAAAGTRTIRLVATAAGQRLYESEGFRASQTITQYQGLAEPPSLPEDPRVRPAEEADWAAIARLDAEAIGGDRARMLAELKRVGSAVVLGAPGAAPDGFAICRPFGRGRVIGPIVARAPEDAIALAAFFMRAHEAMFLRVDTPEREGAFVDFVEACGLAQVDRVVQMTRGTPPATGPARTFGLTNQALG
ncbi:N-acetyltransferase [Aureimonas endophytica]|uniref:N-acetyltransferase n=1 Tax=Aureimonas endophytica TaxID=2027858 RepID=A0A916ZT54_9HYPH|nr:GNAT family N-acetyltransferase [Aureimonas endophytica]GGE10313.1 N-acetyltransferase [Aureimonas endophytica]